MLFTESYFGKWNRFWEIDFLRGIAVMAMVVFHLLFDLNYFGIYPADLYSGLWFIVGRFAAIVFIFLVGLSLTISYSKACAKNLSRQNHFSKYLKRGLRIFLLGLVITLATFIFFPAGAIWFGVLHLIGISIIITFPFLRFKKLNIVLGAILIIAGLYLMQFTFSFPHLLWLGFFPQNFYTFDYFPLLPWFGVVLLGIFTGNLLYPNAKRRINPETFPAVSPKNPICFLGRHSLAIYFIHQPLLIALLYFFA